MFQHTEIQTFSPSEKASWFGQSQAAFNAARVGGKLLSDYRQAPGLGAVASGRAFHRLSQALCHSNRLQVYVEGTVPRGPAVVVANHASYLDPIVIGGLVPCTPVAKGEVRSWPVVGDLAARYGTLFVRRGDAFSGFCVLRHGLALLREGGTLLNFPEGTTNWGTVARFKRGVFGLAQLADVPIVPVALDMLRHLSWVGEQTFVPHYLGMVRSGPHTVRVRFGQPLRARGRSAEQLAEAARRHIESLLGLPGVPNRKFARQI